MEGSLEKIEEQSLRQMETLLHHSTRGIHALFDNKSIANILKNPTDHKVFMDVDKIKLVQGILTQLISKKSYNEKMSFLRDLNPESYEMLIRTYFHIVENTIRSNSSLQH